MIKKWWFVFFILPIAYSFGQEPEKNNLDLIDIVEKINTIERKYYSFEKYLKIHEFDLDDKVLSTAKIKLLRKGNNSLTVFLSPAKQKGKIILQIDDSYYIYFPKAKKYARISPRSNMFGSVAIGDIMTPPLLENYNYALLEKQEDKILIEFTAKQGKKVAFYKKISTFRVDRKNEGLTKVENYTKSGVLFGTAFYNNYQNDLPVNIKVTNILNKNRYAVITVLSEEPKEFDDWIFKPSYLKYIQ